MKATAREAAAMIAAAALARVQEPLTARVRVEDYLAALGALTGEAALVDAGVLDIETTDIPPGAPVFGDPINHVLTGDTTDLALVPPDSAVGILLAELVPAVVSIDEFGSLESLYRSVAAGVGSAPWGAVTTSVGPDHQPTLLPIRVAFELRPAVDAAMAAAGLPARQRHTACALALAAALRQVSRAIDMRVGLTLALETVFGMAKMAPMSRRAFAAANAPAPAAGQE